MLKDPQFWHPFSIVFGVLLLITSNACGLGVTELLTLFLYAIPFEPLLARGVLFVKYYDIRNAGLNEGERATDQHRSYTIGMAAMSFAGVLALSFISSPLSHIQLIVFYLIISFLWYLWALNIQSYKYSVAWEILSDALLESANLSLIASVVTIVFSNSYNTAYEVIVLCLGALAWLPDHIKRLRLVSNDYKSKRQNKDEPSEPDVATALIELGNKMGSLENQITAIVEQSRLIAQNSQLTNQQLSALISAIQTTPQ